MRFSSVCLYTTLGINAKQLPVGSETNTSFPFRNAVTASSVHPSNH